MSFFRVFAYLLKRNLDYKTMSRRKAVEPLTKVTLNLFTRDYERMQALYPQVGATVAVRTLVREHVKKIEARTTEVLDTTEDIEVELEE